jgi:sec-independent protein translocase protein TatA
MVVLFISGAEILVIFLIILLLFGADKIPDIAKGLGKGIRQVKDATQEIKSEIQKSAKKRV